MPSKNVSLAAGSLCIIVLIGLCFMANSAYKEKLLKEFLLSLKQRYPTAHIFRPTEEEFIVVDYIHNSVKRIIRDAKGNEKVEDQKEISIK